MPNDATYTVPHPPLPLPHTDPSPASRPLSFLALVLSRRLSRARSPSPSTRHVLAVPIAALRLFCLVKSCPEHAEPAQLLRCLRATRWCPPGGPPRGALGVKVRSL